MKYENVIFDLYGTLVDIWTDENRKRVWESLAWYFCLHQAKYSWKELKKAYFNEVKLQEERLNKEIGGYAEIDLMKVFEQLYLKKGQKAEECILKETMLMFRALSMKRLQLYEGVEDLLKSLKEKGRKVYLLTNAQRVFTEREIEMLHLKEYFDDIVYSSDERVKKPDVRFYNVMIRRHHLNPETTVMVGNDGFCDIEGALVAGIQAIHVHSNIEGSKPCPKEIQSIPVKSMDLLKNELLKEILK